MSIETVLLVEPDGKGGWKMRERHLRFPINVIMERCRLDPNNPSLVWERKWINTNNERDLSGNCRVFREELPPPPKEEPEKPLYDELVVKNLKLGVDGATFARMAKKYGKK